MSFRSGEFLYVPGNRNLLVKLGVGICLLNLLLVGILAGTGTLRTAQPGDISYTKHAEAPHGEFISLPSDSPVRFVVETPTDVDVFYNIVTAVRNGLPLYPYTDKFESGNPTVQLRYNYAPAVFFLFVPFYFAGYLGFKLLWLLLSIFCLVSGTYLLVRAESPYRTYVPSRRTTILLSFAALGFQPTVANLKVGQTTPIVYLFVALFWWYYRRGKLTASGSVLVGATLIKPYFMIPLVVLFRRDRLPGLISFMAALVGVNVLSIFIFGPDTVATYYGVLVNFLVDEGATVRSDSFENWSSSHFRPFFWLGPYASVVRLVCAIPLAYVTARNAFGMEESPVELFSLSLVTLMVFLQTTTAIDLGILLAPILLLGYKFFDQNTPELAILLIAVALLQVHAYVLELLVGVGPTFIDVLAANEGTVIALLPGLQPAAYGTGILLGLTIYARRGVPFGTAEPDRESPVETG
jgi:hypothetical protein